MPITKNDGGGTIITGGAIRLWQLLQWKYAIKLEEQGIRVAHRSVTAHAKRVLGVKGNRDAVLRAIEQRIKEEKAASDF
jgi:hypothetical protein